MFGINNDKKGIVKGLIKKASGLVPTAKTITSGISNMKSLVSGNPSSYGSLNKKQEAGPTSMFNKLIMSPQTPKKVAKKETPPKWYSPNEAAVMRTMRGPMNK